MTLHIKFDDLGDEIKSYERVETDRRFMPCLPVYARIDGRAFSKFTQGMIRPYDKNMTEAMIQTTRALVAQTNACVGYTQSDEISLAWYDPNGLDKVFFNGKVHKMVSHLAAIASVHFLREVMHRWPEKLEKDNLPTFDARVYQFPTLELASKAFLWREMDATKNSVSMAAQSVYSHRQLHKKGTKKKLDMLLDKGIQWNDYPTFFKRGVYIQRIKRYVELEDYVLDSIPAEYVPENGMAWRSRIEELDIPPLTRIENKSGVLFFQEEPKLFNDK